MGRGYIQFAKPNGRPGISNAPVLEYADQPEPSLLNRAADVVAAVLPKRKTATPNQRHLSKLIAARNAAQAALDKYKADQEKAREPVDAARDADRLVRRAERKIAEHRGDDAGLRLLQLALGDAERDAERLWRIAAPAVEAQRAALRDAGGGIEAYDFRRMELERDLDQRTAAVRAIAEDLTFAEHDLDAALAVLVDATAAVNAALLPMLAARAAFAHGELRQRIEAALAGVRIGEPAPDAVADFADALRKRATELRQEPPSPLWQRIHAERAAAQAQEQDE